MHYIIKKLPDDFKHSIGYEAISHYVVGIANTLDELDEILNKLSEGEYLKLNTYDAQKITISRVNKVTYE